MKNNRTTALLMLLVFFLVVAVVIIFLTGLERNSTRENPYENVTATAAPVPTAAETPAVSPSAAPSAVPTTAPVYYPPSTAAPVQTAKPVTTASPSGTGTGTGTAPAATSTPTPTPATGEPGMLPAEQLIPVVPGATPASGDGSTGEASGGAPSVSTIPVGTVIGRGVFRSDTGTALNIHADWSATISGEQTVDITVAVYADHYTLFTTATPGALNISVDRQYVSLASPAIDYSSNLAASTQINSHSFTVSLASGEIRDVPVQVVWMYRGTYSGVELPTVECGGNITISR